MTDVNDTPPVDPTGETQPQNAPTHFVITAQAFNQIVAALNEAAGEMKHRHVTMINEALASGVRAIHASPPPPPPPDQNEVAQGPALTPPATKRRRRRS